MKINTFIADQALLEGNWNEVVTAITSHFGLSKTHFWVKNEISPKSTRASRAVLVLVKEHKSYSFSILSPEDLFMGRSQFESWEWDSPIPVNNNYLLIL